MDQPSRKPNTDNRRDFLRESLMLAAVPTALAGKVAEAAFDVGLPTQTVKLGVLGCGRRGMQLARAALASSVADVKLCGLADIFPDRVQQTYRSINSNFADRVLIGAADRYTGMRAAQQLADSDVQAVIVSAAPGFRPSHLRLLADAGKHLYVERPLATSLADTRQVAELTQQVCQQGQAIQFGMQHRYQPFFTALVEQLRQGAIGQPILARLTLERPAEPLAVRSKRVCEHDFRLRHWQQDAALGGHPLVEQLSGQLDLVNWIAGQTPESASPISASDQLIEVRMFYSNGLRLDCQLRHALSGPGTGLSLLVQGTAGWCDVLKGKIYSQANSLIWTAPGTSADSQAAVDTWLANARLRSNTADLSHISDRQFNTAIEANLTALLGQLALKQRSMVTWKSLGS
jgi:myo-inositol 2-dehydrogenase / D-chiro-inositol 1-dehydrogenase